MLENEFAYYKTHQDDLLKLYADKVVVIVGESVVGAYDTEIEAYENSKKSHALGTFLIQKCVPGAESYSMTFHSRVAFA